MNQPSRKERELALRHAIIFEATEAVLTERGYHGASVDEIAKRAQISVGTSYGLGSVSQESSVRTRRRSCRFHTEMQNPSEWRKGQL